MSLDLNKLANKLDEALSNETSETLTKFLTDKRMNINKQTTPIFTTSEFTTATIAKPKKIVGWYCLGNKNRANCVSFGTYSKPNFIKRFFMKTLLDFYWVKETQQ